MWVYDLETLSFLTVNDAAIQSYGYSLEDFLSMTIEDIQPAEEKKRLDDQGPKGDRGTLPEPSKHLKNGGSTIDVEATALPLIFDGKRAELITATDVTARLRAECERQVILDITQSMNVTTNLDELLRFIHQSLKRVLYAENCFVAFHDQTTDLIHFPYWIDKFDPVPPPQPIGDGFTSHVLRTGQALSLTGEFKEQKYSEGTVKMSGTSSVSWLGVPLQTPSRTLVGFLKRLFATLALDRQGNLSAYGREKIDVMHNSAGRRTSVQSGAYVLLSVSDTGTGMDAVTQERIFEPFFTTKGVDKGTGLGLSTVYGVVKQSGGNISVFSEVGKGTSFKVYLPRVDAATEVRLAEGAVPGVSLGTETILLVEDEQMVRHLALHILEASGYTVLEAASAHEAIEICKVYEGPVHLLLTDVVMPNMSGPRLSEEVMKIRTGISVLYMSGYTDNAIVHQGVLDEGMYFLQKPFSPDALALKVRECLDSTDRNGLIPAMRLSKNLSSIPHLVTA